MTRVWHLKGPEMPFRVFGNDNPGLLNPANDASGPLNGLLDRADGGLRGLEGLGG